MLEERVAASFAAHGYDVRTNVVLQGRSGGRHEIDVLATKDDGVTSYTVAVECKAWRAPIEKDVIAKLRLVLDDLGINKGIVVGLAGGRSGAHLAADDHGIEVWDRAELAARLGPDLAGGTAPGHEADGGAGEEWGLAPRLDPPAGLRALEGRLRRKPRRDREELRWAALVWLPAYAMRLTTSQHQVLRRGTQLTSSTLDGVYEAVAGTYLGPPERPWEVVTPDGRPRLRPVLRPSQVQQEMVKAVKAYARVSTAAALERHGQVLAGLGLPVPCESLTVDACAEVLVPYHLGIAGSWAGERVVAVSAASGAPATGLGRALTRDVSRLRAELHP